MIIHNFDPILVDLGLFQVRWYSIAYIFGIIIGWAYAIKIIKITSLKKNNFDQIKAVYFNEIITYLIIGIILGGRLGYIFFYNFDYYSKNFFEILKIWHGGMSFHGGLLGVIVAVLIFSKKNNLSFFKITDIISCVAPIGIFLGRIANFINGELYGKVSTLPWAVIFPNSGTEPRHPSQLYEAFLEGLFLFFIINYLALKKELLFKEGAISGIFLILYSVFRIISENFREPDQHLGYIFNYFSMGTILSAITFLAGCFMIFTFKKQ